MAFTIPQQINQLVDDKKNAVILFRKNGSGDAIGASAALYMFLTKLGKNVDIISEQWISPKPYQFLKPVEKIQSGFSHLQKFIITMDVKESGVQELSYDLRDEKLRVYITPKQGFLTRDHVRTAQTDFRYDLIFVLDTPDLESLGALYDNNTELFHKTPIVNIDHHPANEHFGQINLIDLTTASTAEIVFDLFKKLGEENIDADIATALLTGLIAKTRSFKTENVKPHTLAAGSRLMSLGGNREQIINQLFRTRSMNTLKLWGFALTHMQNDAATGLVWSTLTREDFVRSDTSEEELYDIMAELLGSSPQAKIILLLHESKKSSAENLIQGLIHTVKPHHAKQLVEKFQATGAERDATFTIANLTLKAAEETVIANIKQILSLAKT
ncbi:MAG: DHH family phosphoesterase [Candidatus Magasanikbacteria bacterium]|nr:DHH family phosphoesterase [Candidatus Magasanikbacteria bacterium]